MPVHKETADIWFDWLTRADKKTALKECFRILKPGGRLSIAEPVMRDCALAAASMKRRLEETSGDPNLHPFIDSLLAVLGIFLPGLLLITGVLPFWRSLRNKNLIRKSLRGIGAAVVGVLVAALYSPIWTGTVHSVFDFLGALGAFVISVQWRVQP